jgi:hypothetical protein
MRLSVLTNHYISMYLWKGMRLRESPTPTIVGKGLVKLESGSSLKILAACCTVHPANAGWLICGLSPLSCSSSCSSSALLISHMSSSLALQNLLPTIVNDDPVWFTYSDEHYIFSLSHTCQPPFSQMQHAFFLPHSHLRGETAVSVLLPYSLIFFPYAS